MEVRCCVIHLCSDWARMTVNLVDHKHLSESVCLSPHGSSQWFFYFTKPVKDWIYYEQSAHSADLLTFVKSSMHSLIERNTFTHTHTQPPMLVWDPANVARFRLLRTPATHSGSARETTKCETHSPSRTYAHMRGDIHTPWQCCQWVSVWVTLRLCCLLIL